MWMNMIAVDFNVAVDSNINFDFDFDDSIKVFTRFLFYFWLINSYCSSLVYFSSF